jgi:uncharacterized membrane protein (DUF2068 family)
MFRPTKPLLPHDLRAGSPPKALRAIAWFEAAKGALVLLAGFGLAAFLHRDAERIAEVLVTRLHLNPAKGHARIFLELLGDLSSGKLWLLAGFAAGYALLRFIEAYGLWWDRPWAKWVAVVSGGVYVPFEIYELSLSVTWVKVTALIINVSVVAYMARSLWAQRLLRQRKGDGHA